MNENWIEANVIPLYLLISSMAIRGVLPLLRRLMAKFIILSNNVEKHGSFAFAIILFCFSLARSRSLPRSLNFLFPFNHQFSFLLFRNFIFFGSAYRQTDMKNVSYVVCSCVRRYQASNDMWATIRLTKTISGMSIRCVYVSCVGVDKLLLSYRNNCICVCDMEGTL